MEAPPSLLAKDDPSGFCLREGLFRWRLADGTCVTVLVEPSGLKVAATLGSSPALAVLEIPHDEAAPGFTRPSGAAAADVDHGTIASPVSGRVAQVNAKSGQAVKARETILTIESMKMTIAVNAPRDCTIDTILVAPGAAVKRGEPLAVWR